jgi:cell wall-associated NlpC family hydrolase
MKGQLDYMFFRKLVTMLCAVLMSAVFIARPAHAAVPDTGTRLRVVAYEYAIAQAGKWYCWGGTGPSCYDCSGLVYEAYLYAHIALPRTTYGMLASNMLVRISKSQARRGDLAFYGDGHVEMVDTPNVMFGAETTGTQIGFTKSTSYWHPTAFYRIRGAGRT